MNNKFFNIAIGGLDGAGRSTLGRELAKELNCLFLNTGSLYRALTLECLKKNINLDNPQAIMEGLEDTDITVKYKNSTPVILINGKAIDEKMAHSERVDKAITNVSKIGQIRENVRNIQRSLAKSHNIVIEGRDIGSVVLPDADVKLFITASTEVRADRRFIQNVMNRRTLVNYQDIFDSIIERDWEDNNRTESPLKVSDDAIVIDTTHLTIKEALKIAKQECSKKKITPAYTSSVEQKEHNVKQSGKIQTLIN